MSEIADMRFRHTWDIGKVYKRLIKMVAKDEKISIVDALFKVYNSFISAQKLMIITAVFIMRIHHIFLNATSKMKCCEKLRILLSD